LPAVQFKLQKVSTPGDRDKKKDLRVSPADFFTKDLDDALLSGKIDCAVHSAKDLPDPMPEGIDWFWLPWSEDARDVIILPKLQRHKGTKAQSFKSETNSNFDIRASKLLRIGVSSARREEYCRKRFPDAELLSVRGNIDERIAQLDAGKFDMLIMAAAGLNRLGLDNRISEYIPLHELPPPEGQGFLAVTFRKNDELFCEVRKLFVKSVVFAGAGPGDANLATVETVNALRNCDVCLYDALLSNSLLDSMPPEAQKIYVGKRMSAHSSPQNEINDLIAKFARQGKRLVRLKGGDPTIFGRLAEEIETLDELFLPYRVIPGVSSLNAVGATGLMLTRRGLSRGFSVMTPRKSGSSRFEHVSKAERLSFPSVFFMGLSETANIAKSLIKDGRRKDEPAAIVLSAGNESEQKIVSGSLGGFARSLVKIPEGDAPGIFIVGENANQKYVLKKNGALAGMKVLLTCSEAIMDKAVDKIRDLGGISIRMPMIKLAVAQASRLCSSSSSGIFPVPAAKIEEIEYEREMWLKRGSLMIKNQEEHRQDACVTAFEWIIITSPSAVSIFMDSIKKQIQHRQDACATAGFDIRGLPKIMVCGPGTADEFRKYGISPDLEAEEHFGAEGLLDILKMKIKKGDRILRLRSDKADERLTCELRNLGADVTDEILYRNIPVKYEKLPDFDSVVFASSSAVESFRDNFGLGKLKGKYTVAIGKPTLETLKKLKCTGKIILAKEATVNGCIESLAGILVEKRINLRSY
jgi:uroporphyrinogen III methyltransferase/synthase